MGSARAASRAGAELRAAAPAGCRPVVVCRRGEEAIGRFLRSRLGPPLEHNQRVIQRLHLRHVPTFHGISIAELVRTFSHGNVADLLRIGLAQAKAQAETRAVQAVQVDSEAKP